MSLDPLLLQMLGNKGSSENSNPLLSMLQNQDSLSPRAQMLMQLMSVNNQDNVDDMDDVIASLHLFLAGEFEKLEQFLARYRPEQKGD